MSTIACESIVYTSFDRFPNQKGAAIHIAAFCRGLVTAFGNVTLITPETSPVMSNERDFPRVRQSSIAPGWEHVVVPALGDNLMQRVLSFRHHADAWWRTRRATVIHFRSIFEGYPLARTRSSRCEKLVYEVNGLPSIELKYHYPGVADDAELLTKLRAQEQFCLEAADLIVTVSQTNAALLIRRGVAPQKIRVIPNGVDPEIFTYRSPQPLSERPIKLLYSGTFSPWQGVDLAIESLAMLRRDYPATLLLVGTAVSRQLKLIVKTCQQFGVSEHVTILPATTQAGLATLHHAADVILAPLRATERNTSQGCCPLKVIEAMASGTPLIASDLPVVRELAVPDHDALLVRPGSAKAIKDALLRLLEQPTLGPQLSRTARETVERRFTWQRAQAELIAAYHDVLGVNPILAQRSN